MRVFLRESLVLVLIAIVPAFAVAAPDPYEGKYCAGAGDAAYLKLIDQLFAFLHANPDVPNLTRTAVIQSPYRARRSSCSEHQGIGN